MVRWLGGVYAYFDIPEVTIDEPNKLTSALSPFVRRMVRTSLGFAASHVLTVVRYAIKVPACQSSLEQSEKRKISA